MLKRLNLTWKRTIRQSDIIQLEMHSFRNALTKLNWVRLSAFVCFFSLCVLVFCNIDNKKLMHSTPNNCGYSNIAHWNCQVTELKLVDRQQEANLHVPKTCTLSLEWMNENQVRGHLTSACLRPLCWHLQCSKRHHGFAGGMKLLAGDKAAALLVQSTLQRTSSVPQVSSEPKGEH